MARSGLLILTQPLSHLKSLIPHVVRQASVTVNDTLYICLQPALRNRPLTQTSLLQPVASTKEVQSFIRDFYMSGSNVCHTLDIRVLLSHISSNTSAFSAVPYRLKKEMSVILSDSTFLKEAWNMNKLSLIGMIQDSFENVNRDIKFSFVSIEFDQQSNDVLETPSEALRTFPNVILGGTFDRLHAGHKLLLSDSCLVCDQKLTVGITDGERNKKKLLWELMEPYVDREEHVVSFVKEVKPSIIMEPVRIFDAYGPTITDPNLDCIVVSKETQAGGLSVNQERQKLGFKELEMVAIDLVEDACHADDEELKVSSSSFRKRLLGTLLQPPVNRLHIPKSPYRIAVTGGIACGKSNVCSELEKLGAKVINCDLLGHKAYTKDTAAYHAIVKEFGDSLLDDKGEINRQKLGAIVFSDKSKLGILNSIVWPAIRLLAEEELANYRKSGAKFVILEAAVLFEAGWNDMVHEIWTAFVSRDEAVQRIIKRNKLSQEEAEKRIDSQISNVERISKSNVVICPQWEFEITRKQIHKAWSLLQTRVKTEIENKL